ncbi:hypothetical protein SB861_21260 [Paraburkholderia sp. SIMBA_049]
MNETKKSSSSCNARMNVSPLMLHLPLQCLVVQTAWLGVTLDPTYISEVSVLVSPFMDLANLTISGWRMKCIAKLSEVEKITLRQLSIKHPHRARQRQQRSRL